MSIVRRFLLLLQLLLPLAATAQVDEAIEQWLTEGGSESVASDLSDRLLQLADSPVNLNDTAALDDIPFLSPFQIRALRNYVQLYGQLLSIDELAMVPSFDSLTLALLRPFVTVAPCQPPVSFSLSDMLARGHHTLTTGIGGTIEQAQGYSNGHYEGDNLRALLCYSFSYGHHLSLRFSADKDPAEAWGSGNFVGYHLMVEDIGRLEKLVVGRYNLRFGQGLTLWTGFAPFSILGTSPVRFAGGIAPASPFNEQGYQEGVAASVRMGKGLSLSTFASRAEEKWLGGAHLTLRHGNLVAGITAAATLLDDSLPRHDYVYNQSAFHGDRQAVAGIDAMWQRGRLLLFGEAALSQGWAPAVVAGARLTAGSDNSLGLTLRHYDSQYHNLHASAYSVGETNNEQGISLDARLRLPMGLRALVSADIHRFPSLRYGCYTPSYGTWLRAQVGRNIGPAEVTLRGAWRWKQRNQPGISDSNLYLSEQTLRAQQQLQVRFVVGEWTLTSRLLWAWFDPEASARQQGWLAAQEARYTAPRWQVAMQVAWFDVDGYYARLYLTEANLQYAFSFPSYYGRGLRASILARYDINTHFRLSFKYALFAYPGQETVGSGDATTLGPLRQTWHVQLRYKF